MDKIDLVFVANDCIERYARKGILLSKNAMQFMCFVGTVIYFMLVEYVLV